MVVVVVMVVVVMVSVFVVMVVLMLVGMVILVILVVVGVGGSSDGVYTDASSICSCDDECDTLTIYKRINDLLLDW